MTRTARLPDDDVWAAIRERAGAVVAAADVLLTRANQAVQSARERIIESTRFRQSRSGESGDAPLPGPAADWLWQAEAIGSLQSAILERALMAQTRGVRLSLSHNRPAATGQVDGGDDVREFLREWSPLGRE